MEYVQEIRVLYADTDSYGVVWHGSYVRWFEAARVGVVEQTGLCLEELERDKIIFPVVDLNIRYKSSAKMNEKIIIKTSISELTPFSVSFEHKVFEKESGKLRVNAKTTIVAFNSETGKLYRKMPEYIYEKFSQAAEKN